MKQVAQYILLNAAPVRAITSSTNATPIVVTATAHGYATGDLVTINGHATNTAANGTWTVTKITNDTFSLDGSVGNGIGGATGCRAVAAKIAHSLDYSHCQVSFDTDGGGDAAMTVKIVGSNSETCPDFAKAQSATNRYEFF